MSGIRSLTRRPTVVGTASGSSAPVYIDSDDNLLKSIPAGSGTTEVSYLDTSTVSQTILATKTITGALMIQQAAFVEDATSLTHTATFTIPAGSTLYDIVVTPQVLWTAGAATISVGDANSATGWFNALDLKATDLILGERLQAIGGTRGWGGKPGSYLVDASGRFGQQSTNMIGGYCPTAYSVIGVVTVTTPATTVGRTFMYVMYTIGSSVTPVLA